MQLMGWYIFQAMSALEEKSKVEKTLKELQKIQGEQQVWLRQGGFWEDIIRALRFYIAMRTCSCTGNHRCRFFHS